MHLSGITRTLRRISSNLSQALWLAAPTRFRSRSGSLIQSDRLSSTLLCITTIAYIGLPLVLPLPQFIGGHPQNPFRAFIQILQIPCRITGSSQDPQKPLGADTEYFCSSIWHGVFACMTLSPIYLPCSCHATNIPLNTFSHPPSPGHCILLSQALSTRKLLRTMLVLLINDLMPRPLLGEGTN